jgi:hypothetical protein
MTYVYCIDADTICFLFVCVDVAPHGHEVELLRVPDRQEPGRQSWGGSRVGERRQHEDVEARLADPERATRRHRFDDPGVGPSHAPSVDVGANFEDIHRRLEAVLQGVLKGMWSRIWDEGILE